MSKPWDGTCRGNNTGQIIDVLEECGHAMTLREIADRMGRGIPYTRSLVEECDAVHYRVTLLPVSSWQVELNDMAESGKR